MSNSESSDSYREERNGHLLKKGSFTTDKHRSDRRRVHEYWKCVRCGERRERKTRFNRIECSQGTESKR